MESCIVSKIVQSSFPRLDFVPRDYEFEKSENDSEFARLEYNVPLLSCNLLYYAFCYEL